MKTILFYILFLGLILSVYCQKLDTEQTSLLQNDNISVTNDSVSSEDNSDEEPTESPTQLPEPICTFPTISYTFARYTVFSSIEPSKRSDEVIFSTSSVFPSGITFNPETGVLSGTATEIGSFSIEIECTLNEESISNTLDLSINQMFCSADNGFPSTEITMQGLSYCDNELTQTGNRKRNCLLVDNTHSEWGDIQRCQWKAPWGLHYNFQSVEMLKYDRINNDLVYSGRLTGCTVSPDLPESITLNPTSCLISGQARSVISSTVYTITAFNEDANATTTLTLRIQYGTCAASDGFPELAVGHNHTLACPDSVNYEGYRLRVCIDDGTQIRPRGDVNTCKMKAPTAIVYGNYNFIQGYTYRQIAVTPTYQHIVSYWNITPELPSGLELYRITGIIMGTTYDILPNSDYQITASNADASTTIQISIQVDKGVCDEDGEWPVTLMGEVATLSCIQPDIYQGKRSRMCIEGIVPEWGSPAVSCSLRRPYGVKYPYTDMIFYKGYNNVTFTPTYSGLVDRWSIKPSLPAGLSMNETTGTISGTPEVLSESVTYSVYAINTVGNSIIYIHISVDNYSSFEHHYTYHLNTSYFWYVLTICYSIVCFFAVLACLYTSYRKAKYPFLFMGNEEEKAKKREAKKKLKEQKKKEQEEAKRLKKLQKITERNRHKMI